MVYAKTKCRINIIDGSGLFLRSKISPRAACGPKTPAKRMICRSDMGSPSSIATRLHMRSFAQSSCLLKASSKESSRNYVEVMD